MSGGKIKGELQVIPAPENKNCAVFKDSANIIILF